MFERTLNFQPSNLDKDIDLLLCFHPLDDQKLWVDYFPVVWKVIKFASQGSQIASVTYNSQLMFSRPQINDSNIVSPGTWIDIDLGQQTTLNIDPSGNAYFSTPSSITGGGQDIIANNQSGAEQNIGVGFEVNKKPNTVLLFEGVGNKSRVKTQFTPTLAAYVVSGYQENQVLKGEIETGPFWSQNLTNLAASTNWTIVKNSDGSYSINQDLSATNDLWPVVKMARHPKFFRARISSDLSFNNFLTSLKKVVDNLVLNKYIDIKVVTYDTDISLEFTVPDGISLCQAGDDLRVAIDIQASDKRFKVSDIKKLGGQLFVQDMDDVQMWTDIDNFDPAYVLA